MSQVAEKKIMFRHHVWAGSAYQVGQLQGEMVKETPGAKAFFTSCGGRYSGEELDRILELYDSFCPGLCDELAGFADSLGASIGDVLYVCRSYLKAAHCSQLVVLPALTAEKKVLVGRSYEFSEEMDDLSLCTTRVEGNYAHMGFSSLLFGRLDGMNECGLSVTMSAAGMPVGELPGMKPPVDNGFHFWVLLRAILDRCATLEEAVRMAESFPLCCNLNLIVAHKSGAAALIERVGSHQSIKTIGPESEEQFICSTNHLTQPDMVHHVPTMMKNSGVRRQTVTSRIENTSPAITKETIRGILSDPYPDGLCFHYYQEFFGTLWSLMFDLEEGTAEVCFGSPIANRWYTFSLPAPQKPARYEATLPLEKAAPDFWNQVPLESM